MIRRIISDNFQLAFNVNIRVVPSCTGKGHGPIMYDNNPLVPSKCISFKKYSHFHDIVVSHIIEKLSCASPICLFGLIHSNSSFNLAHFVYIFL